MKTEYFPPMWGTRQKIIIPLQHYTRSAIQDNQAIKRNKRHTDWKRRDKILSTDDIIAYVDNIKHRKLCVCVSVCVRDGGVGVAVRRIEITKKKSPEGI